MDESPQFGRYEILERLGKGGMGVIYKAHDSQLDRVVALKTILPDFLASPEVKERLIREAQAAARLQHPNVVTVFDIGETEDKRLYFAMEYVRGQSLREVIPMRIPLERRLEIMADVCKALDFAHQHGIIHRDVKPTNVLLAEDGTVKLFDFGIAHLAGSSLTRTGVAIGTPEYMSPEMVEGGELDARSDIFSCGVMLYEMLTRNNPFRSDRITTTMYRIVHSEPSTLRELRPNLPADLEEILAKMLAKDPADRYASMAEVVDDLEHIVSRGLLSKAIRAKKLGDLMERVEAKVSAAEGDPQARKLMEDQLAEPLSRRRRQVRKIAKAADTSITVTHIDRELMSLRQFDERLDQFLEEILPEGAPPVPIDDISTADPPASDSMHPGTQDSAATMRWEGETTARQGMAAALSGDRDTSPESSSAPAPQPLEEAGEEAEKPHERESRPDASAGTRDSETEPTIVVPTSPGKSARRWLVPAALLAVVLLAALGWFAAGLLTSGSGQNAQDGRSDSAQGASLPDGGSPQPSPQAGDASSQSGGSPGEPGSPGGGTDPQQRTSAAPSATQGASAGSAASDAAGGGSGASNPPAGNSAAPASFTFEVSQAEARRGLIAVNRDCAGTLELQAEMIRFRSEECTSRTLVRTILRGASLEEGVLTVTQTNGTSYAFNISQADRPRLRRALGQLGW